MDLSPSPLSVFTYVAYLLVALIVYWFVRDGLRSLGRRIGVTRRAAVPVFLLAGAGFVELHRRVPTDGPGELPFAVAAGGYLLGVILVAVALGNAPTFLRARRTETTITGTVDPGFVELSGEARPLEAPGEAPFSGRDALYYEYEIRERQNLLARTVTRTIDVGSGGAPFLVDDGTGEVLIDPSGADVRLGRDRRVTETADGDERPPERIREFLADEDTLGPTDDRRIYREWVLEPGAEVYVQGVAETEYAGEYPRGTVVGASGDCFLAPGSVESVERSLRRGVLLGGTAGLFLTAAGFVGMATVAGVL